MRSGNAPPFEPDKISPGAPDGAFTLLTPPGVKQISFTVLYKDIKHKFFLIDYVG
jgi:hypothetical protein